MGLKSKPLSLTFKACKRTHNFESLRIIVILMINATVFLRQGLGFRV